MKQADPDGDIRQSYATDFWGTSRECNEETGKGGPCVCAWCLEACAFYRIQSPTTQREITSKPHISLCLFTLLLAHCIHPALAAHSCHSLHSIEQHSTTVVVSSNSFGPPFGIYLPTRPYRPA